jgi:hypothetical protein
MLLLGAMQLLALVLLLGDMQLLALVLMLLMATKLSPPAGISMLLLLGTCTCRPGEDTAATRGYAAARPDNFMLVHAAAHLASHAAASRIPSTLVIDAAL